MDKQRFEERLAEGAGKVGVSLSAAQVQQLSRLAEELLRWNQKVNLTAITEDGEVAEKHMIDSLAVWPEVEGSAHLLDLGAGAGFPGLPLKVAFPSMAVTLVDAVAKKVGFIKQMVASLGLAPGARGLHLRANGLPTKEGLPVVDLVISRALMDLEPWMSLASAYVAPGGRVVAMMGQSPGPERAKRAVEAAGLQWVSLREYRLPFSDDPRAVVVAKRQG